LVRICNEVSPDNCTVPNNITAWAPADEDEASMYFLQGLYTGHFQAMAQNDCDANQPNHVPWALSWVSMWTEHRFSSPSISQQHFSQYLWWQTIWFSILISMNGWNLEPGKCNKVGHYHALVAAGSSISALSWNWCWIPKGWFTTGVTWMSAVLSWHRLGSMLGRFHSRTRESRRCMWWSWSNTYEAF
jgi:hypothetical protein